MEILESKQQAIEELLADSDIYTDRNKEKLQQCLQEKADIDKKFSTAENDWLQFSEELEAMSNNISQ